MGFSITGTGSAYPKRVVTNDELTGIVDTTNEWITSRTGIKTRHICTDESLTDLAFEAATRALEDAKVQPADVDLIICATLQGDFVTPSLACVLQERIGATCPAFDVNAACSGFLFALDIAEGYFARDPNQTILVVAADAVSRFTDWDDRSTCVLFGDGAGAAVLQPSLAQEGLLSIRLTTCGGATSLNIPGQKGTAPFKDGETMSAHDEPQTVRMIGQDIYKFAVTSMVRDINHVMSAADVSPEEITYVLAHQANMRILDTAKAKLPIDDGRFITIIERFGNISAASLPLMLDELKRAGRLHKGDVLALSAFGAGLTTGAAVLKW